MSLKPTRTIADDVYDDMLIPKGSAVSSSLGKHCDPNGDDDHDDHDEFS